jgi:hypothetical protein
MIIIQTHPNFIIDGVKIRQIEVTQEALDNGGMSADHIYDVFEKYLSSQDSHELVPINSDDLILPSGQMDYTKPRYYTSSFMFSGRRGVVQFVIIVLGERLIVVNVKMGDQ